MKKKVKFVLYFFMLSIVIICSTAFASYKETISGKAVATMKIPIFTIEESVITEKKLSSKNDNYAEYIFNVLNYIDSENFINEIEFNYTIKIIPSTFNFPVKYRLIDLELGKEITLDSELESEQLILGVEKENHHYKLIAEWDLENNNQNLDENLNIEIQVKGVQKR